MAGKKSENKAVGISRGGRNTKIHALVDGLGNPLGFLLSSGSDHDSVHAISLLSQIVSASDKMSENAEEKMQLSGGEEEKKIDSQ